MQDDIEATAPVSEDAETSDSRDPDLSGAVSHSLQQTVEARLRGLRNYSRLLREIQRGSR